MDEKDIENLDVTIIDPEVIPTEPAVHNPLVSVTPAQPMTVLENNICAGYSLGKSTKVIATELGIDQRTVRETLAKPHIRDFVSELVNAQYATKLEGRLRILNAIVDAKLEKLEEENGGDLSQATKKDVVDLMVISDNMQKERTKKELGTDSNVYLQIINQVTKK